MSIASQQIDEDRLREAALSRLAAQEAIAEEQERQAEEQRKQAVRAEYDRREAEAEQATIVALAQLEPFYVQRKAAAEKAEQALAEFATAELALRARVNALDYGIPPNTYAQKAQQRIVRLRTLAGLASAHGIVGISRPATAPGQKIARTALRAIVSGMIGEGVLHAGQVSARFEVEDGI